MNTPSSKISELRYRQIPQAGSLIGFASLLYDGQIRINDIAVHLRLKPTHSRQYRCAYPVNPKTQQPFFYPINVAVSTEIERAISSHIENIGTRRE
jgi:hypothetical protein